MRKSVVVRRYSNQRQFENDARQMTRKRYHVVSVTSQPQDAGCLGLLTFGIFSLLFPRKPMLIVTYSL